MSETVPPLPPATFEFLVFSLRAQAEMQMGLVRLEQDKEPEKNLPMARHLIDMLAMLVDKTKGNLDLEEQRLLENSVTELRFLFVQASTRGGSQ